MLIELLRRLSLERRLAALDGAFETARMLAISGLRWRHPDAGEEDIEALYYRLVLGPEIGERVLARKRARGMKAGAASSGNGS